MYYGSQPDQFRLVAFLVGKILTTASKGNSPEFSPQIVSVQREEDV